MFPPYFFLSRNRAFMAFLAARLWANVFSPCVLFDASIALTSRISASAILPSDIFALVMVIPSI
ncbi:hypothetical protein D3C74_499820 [compost metagenome]